MNPNNKCADCRFANKSANKDYVFCTFWQEKCNQSGKTEEEFVINDMLPVTAIENVGLGWGYPSKHYQLESHWSHKGTASEGLMWCNQICIHKDERCQHFEQAVLNR